MVKNQGPWRYVNRKFLNKMQRERKNKNVGRGYLMIVGQLTNGVTYT